MQKRLQISIWSDIACPWCYVGKRRFESALASFEHAGEVEVTWRSFELDPSAPRNKPVEDYAQRLAAKYGQTRAQAQARIDQLVAVGQAEGIKLDFTHIRPGNTFDAHRLLHWAGIDRPDRVLPLKQALLRAYFSDGENVADRNVLVRIASAVGLNAEAARRVLESGEYADEVRAQERAFQQAGIHSVPATIVNGQYLISGGQPPDAFENALREIATAAPASQPALH